MALYLAESQLDGKVKSREEFKALTESINNALKSKNARIIEVQVAKDFGRAFWIAEGEEAQVKAGIEEAGVTLSLLKQVRLIGKQPEEVIAGNEELNYLVEWNLPADLTMEKYLERKKTNSVHYAEVPEVTFSRTYVCEDMTKCLCFYNAPDEEAVKRARAAVKAPIDALTPILSDK
jgi:hypothetical protein